MGIRSDATVGSKPFQLDIPGFAAEVIEHFNYAPRPDAEGFTDGHVWDLGSVHVEAQHLQSELDSVI